MRLFRMADETAFLRHSCAMRMTESDRERVHVTGVGPGRGRRDRRPAGAAGRYVVVTDEGEVAAQSTLDNWLDRARRLAERAVPLLCQYGERSRRQSR